MTDDIVLRDYREGDLGSITALMGEIYPPDVVANSRGHWVWQYHDNPRNANGQVSIRVADRGGQVVATLCGIRQHFWLDGRVVSGLWVVDFMALQAGTNQKERLRYGQRLAIELRETQPLVAGVNRPALNRYWKRILGDQIDICALPMMVRPLRPRSLARRKVPVPVLRDIVGLAANAVLPFRYRPKRRALPAGMRFEPVTRFDARFDAFWRDVAPSFRNLSVRDSAYLNWRYVQIPDRPYRIFAAQRGNEIRGWVVTREVRDGGLKKARIVDVLASYDDGELWHYLVTEAVARHAAAGADLVHALDATVPALHQAFLDCGFRANPEQERISQYIAFTTAEGINPDVFYEPSNWHVTLGDSDTDFATPV